MKKVKYIILISMLLISYTVFCKDTTSVNINKNFMPDYSKIQLAGNIGFISIGIGYNLFNSHLQSGILYGYVPEKIANKHIHSIAQKNTYSILGDKPFTPIISLTTNFDLSKNSFYILPDKYPDDYYHSNAIHLSVYLGGKYKCKFDNISKITGLELYTEIGSIDSYIAAYYKSKGIGLKDILNISCGINILF